MCNLRQSFFGLYDYINGGQVKKDCVDMHKAYNIGISQKEINLRIEKLCEHAKKTTEFYDDIDGDKLQMFPVVNKTTYVSNYNKFCSREYLRSKSNRKMSTSGSTGTPFTMIQDKRKIKRCNAAVLFFGEKAGYVFGEKTGELRVWSNGTKNNFKAFWMNKYMCDISCLDDEHLFELYDFIKKKKIRHLLGYSSTYTAFVNYIVSHNIKIPNGSVKSIIAASETLPKDTEDKLRQVFGVPVIMRYSNMENGIMAERVGGGNYYIDSSSYYIEILDLEKDEPVPDGSVGRIVVTDLYNYAFPVIRYDTGDTGAIVKEEIGEDRVKLYFSEIYGRRTDMIYNTKGEMLSPHVITNNMWNVPKVKQFKFVQSGEKEYELWLNVYPGFEEEKETIDKLMQILGIDSEIRISYVDEIPVLASGKRKYIENKWKN